MNGIQYLLQPILNRLMNLIARAIINNADDSHPLQKVQLSVYSDEVRDKVERVQEYGFTSVPKSGCDAVVLFPGGLRNHGIVIATDDGNFRMTGLESGEVALYTDEGDHIHFKRGKIIEIKCGTEVDIKCPMVKISGDLKVGGKIMADGEITAKASAMPTNLSTHKHPTAVPGSPSPPVPGT